MSIQGTVKTWNVAKGYGFLRDAEGNEAFAHHSNLPGPGLLVNEPVSYNVEATTSVNKKGGHQVAVNIQGPGALPPRESEGSLHGRVKLWVSGRSMGIITEDSGEEIHVHSSAFGGGSLTPGKRVSFDLTNEVHNKTGKRIAYNVSGEGVVVVGKLSGKVKAWIAPKGYGFVEMDDGTEVYLHRSALSNGHCLAGKTVFFDLEPQDHETGRKLAKNITGPGVRPGSAVSVGSTDYIVVPKGGKGGKKFAGGKGYRGSKGVKGSKGAKGTKGGPYLK